MKNTKFWIALGISVGIFSSIGLIGADSAEAGCRPTGKRIGGQAVLKCTGPTRCRPTGRYKTVRGVRYQVLRCPR